MSESSGALSKIERLRAVSTMMVDLISENQLDELTVASFSTSAAVGVPLSALNPATVSAAQGVIAGLTANGATSIGGGLSLGLGQLASSTLTRRNVIVLSDGKENTPPMIADVPIPGGTRVFTVGVGLAALLDVDKLELLATENGGYFQLTDGNDEQLAKFFTQIASDLFGQQIAVDPVLTMRQGQLQDIPVQLCDSDHSATVVLTWENPNAVFDFGLVSPSGVSLGSAALTWSRTAPRHRIGRLPLRGSRWFRPGAWTVRVIPQQMPRATDVAVLSVSVVSDLHVNWVLTADRERRIRARPPKGAEAYAGPALFPPPPSFHFPPAGLHPGDTLVVDVAFAALGHGARLIGGEAVVRSPAVSLSELARHFGGLDLDKRTDRDIRREHDGLIKHLASRLGRRPVRRRTYKPQIARDGASLSFRPPLTGPDGIYDPHSAPFFLAL